MSTTRITAKASNLDLVVGWYLSFYLSTYLPTSTYYINIITLYAFFFENVKNIKSTMRHLKYSYISIFTNLLWTDNEMKSVKPIYNHIN